MIGVMPESASAALTTALANDLDGCFEQVVLIFQQRLYCFALRLLGNPQDAEEAAQDTLVRAYNALLGYPPERIRVLALRPWLYQIALNVVRNRVRGQRVTSVPIDDVGEAALLPATTIERPDAYAERTERSRELAAQVLALPERFRIAVVLRHVEGLSYPELAELLQQPIGTIKANVHRGVKLLRAALDAQPQEDV
jgi:RNA polymerase sigma-70 factor, ECF subfamily